MDGQIDTESDADAADVHMEEVRRWPPLSEASASTGPGNLVGRIAEQLGQTPVVPMEEALPSGPLRLEVSPPMDPEDLMERITDHLGYTPTAPATAAPTAQWPSLDDASVDAQRRRTAYKQQRRAQKLSLASEGLTDQFMEVRHTGQMQVRPGFHRYAISMPEHLLLRRLLHPCL